MEKPPARRKSDLTLLGSSSQEYHDRIYTLEFGVNLKQITFEGLNTYSVTVSLLDKKSQVAESLSSVLEIKLKEKNSIISINGGPPYPFQFTKNTLDLTGTELDQSLVEAVENGIAWLNGKVEVDWIVKKDRRKVPVVLLQDAIAVNLLMSSVSTVIGGSMACHLHVVREKEHLFTSKKAYAESMFERLRQKLDEFTTVAINRGVQRYLSHD